MRLAVLLPLGLLGVGLLAGAGGEPDGGAEPPPLPESGDREAMLETIEALCTVLGLDAWWRVFLQAAALGESGLNPVAYRGVAYGAPSWAEGNQSNAEASAAKRAYERHPERFAACPWPSKNYRFGSGGLWAMLPANGLAAFVGTDQICMNPWNVFDVRAAIVMIVEYCRRVMGYSGFQGTPTWGNLRVGMRSVTYLGRADELERQRTGKNKLGDRLEQLGFARSFVDEPVTPLPARDPLQWLQATGFPL